ncbi:hypothetical protein HIM_09429 [Hirsutella minnesotensis 3608]|uniref:Uncharacterized protein n=1 Tax=Hirsutella minnesotensis 3608 TaxID=1043627 RepID=A0A0F8A342_9HYPO|nr:hypothetical protein HIM_09429 [Hirsutella minnesotensis 3608]
MAATTKKADRALDAVKVRCAGKESQAGIRSLGDVVKAADKVKLRAKTAGRMTRKDVDELLQVRDNLSSVPTGFIGQQIRHAVMNTHVYPKTAALAERHETPSAFNDLDNFAYIKARGREISIDPLEPSSCLLGLGYLRLWRSCGYWTVFLAS